MTIAKTTAEILGVPFVEKSFTLLRERQDINIFSDDTLLMIGSPTYAGKLPNKILPDFQNKIKGSCTLAVPIVTYGNRSYDNALAELTAVLQHNGFIVTAAAAIVAEHAFSDMLAKDRPDEADMHELEQFAQKISNKIAQDNCKEEIDVPGNADAPYYVPKGKDGEPAIFLKAKPLTKMELCNHCGICAEKCPLGSISISDPTAVEGICIKCQSCIKNCPTKAKYFSDAMFLSHVSMLQTNYTERKENYYII